MSNNPIEEKSLEELIEEATELIRIAKTLPEMTEEELIEDDAEAGYFQDEDD